LRRVAILLILTESDVMIGGLFIESKVRCFWDEGGVES